MADRFSEGLEKYRTGAYEEAGALFQQELEQDDSNPKTWNALGICLSKMGRYDDASTCFENALGLDPGNTTYEKNLARNKNQAERSPSPATLPGSPDLKNGIAGFFHQLFLTMKCMVSHPHEFFASKKDEDWKVGFKYYIFFAALFAILSGVITAFTINIQWAVSLSAILFVILLIVPFISSAFLALGIQVLGGNRGLHDPLIICVYASIPGLLLGWIPVAGIIAGLFGLFLEIVGVKEMEGFSTVRAIGAILLVPLIIFAITIVLLISAFMILGATLFRMF